MSDQTSPPRLELILETEHWLTHDAAYTNKRASGLVRRLYTALGVVETDRNRLDRELAAEIEEHAATEQRLARDRDVHARLDAIHADVRRTHAKTQHIVETVLRLRAREDLAAVMGYELGHDGAKAETADTPHPAPRCTDCGRDVDQVVYVGGASLCRACETADAPDAAATTGEATA